MIAASPSAGFAVEVVRVKDLMHVAQAVAGEVRNLRRAGTAQRQARDSSAAQIVEPQFSDTGRDAREPPRGAEPVLRPGPACFVC